MVEIISFAKTNFRNQEVQFGIKQDDRRRHFYVIGKTGMGKTNMLENMAIQDIRNGHGVCFIDPHGDTAEKIISMIPPERLDDVIYFNPADQSFPICFNVMEKVDPEYRPLIASGLIGVFKKLWADSWGPRLEYILRNAILGLLEYQGSTLLGVMRILVDKNYRKRIVDKITDPIVKSFWVDEFPKWSEKQIQEVISPIQNKVGQFLTSPIVRNIVGQNKSSFNIREVMDNQKILILNLSKGRIGEDNSALLGAMIITKIQLEAMERVDIPEEERKDFYLYVDEFQNFATESFANILSEARKYRLNLILANQYVNQLDEKVRDAIFGNVGTIVSFRVGATDAEFLEKEFEPIFTMNDIVNLPKYGIYLKLMIDGIAGDAFSATTLPPVERIHPDSTEQVTQMSRQKYAISKQEAEDRIARLLGVLSEEDLMRILAQKNLEKSKEVSQNPISSNSNLTSELDKQEKNENTYTDFVESERRRMEELKKQVNSQIKDEIKTESQVEILNESLPKKQDLEKIQEESKDENTFSSFKELASNFSSSDSNNQIDILNSQDLQNKEEVSISTNFKSESLSENFSNQNLENQVSDNLILNTEIEKKESQNLFDKKVEEIEKSEIKIEEKPILSQEIFKPNTEIVEFQPQNQELSLVQDQKNLSELSVSQTQNESLNNQNELSLTPIQNEEKVKSDFESLNLKLEEKSSVDFVSQKIANQSENEVVGEIQQPKTMFKTNCSTCDTDIEIPFQPDGVRPVFCRECIKDYQRAVAKAKEEERLKNLEENPELVKSQNVTSISSNSKKRKRKKKSQVNKIFSKNEDVKKDIDLEGLREMLKSVRDEEV